MMFAELKVVFLCLSSRVPIGGCQSCVARWRSSRSKTRTRASGRFGIEHAIRNGDLPVVCSSASLAASAVAGVPATALGYSVTQDHAAAQCS
ncbi:hypothetical protein FKP32DRAFT_744381 [Trametes sanguinea]|nr:hypothetical protein FKP32DRAFT_744381 [Trametes sanguinea]